MSAVAEEPRGRTSRSRNELRLASHAKVVRHSAEGATADRHRTNELRLASHAEVVRHSAEGATADRHRRRTSYGWQVTLRVRFIEGSVTQQRRASVIDRRRLQKPSLKVQRISRAI
jgi:hypothetical protein